MQESMSSHQLHSEHILPLKSSLLGGNAPTCFPCSYICNALTPGEQTHLHKCHRWSHTHTHTSIDSRLCEFIWCASFVVSTRWWLMQKTHGGIVLLTWFPLKCGIFCRLSPCRGYNAPVPAKKTPLYLMQAVCSPRQNGGHIWLGWSRLVFSQEKRASEWKTWQGSFKMALFCKYVV